MNSETTTIIVQFIIVIIFGFLVLSSTHSIRHQRAAMPLHQLIVLIFGLLAFTCVVGGIIGILHDAKSDTKLDILGVHLSTGHVGVAFVGIGLIIGYFTIRAVLRNQRDLAALPSDKDEDKREEKQQHISDPSRSHQKKGG